MQVHEYSEEGLEELARRSFMPVITRTRPDFRGRMALHEMGDAVTASRAYSGGAHRAFRTDRMAAKTPGDDLVLSCVHVAGRSRVRQHDRVAELAAGSGVLYEARSAWELLCGYPGRLFDLADDLTPSQRLDAGRAAIDLLAMALRDLTPAVPGGDAPAHVLLGMTRTHVRDHLADPRLRAEGLARRRHVSVRHAQTLVRTDRDDARCVPARAAAACGPGDAVRPETADRPGPSCRRWRAGNPLSSMPTVSRRPPSTERRFRHNAKEFVA